MQDGQQETMQALQQKQRRRANQLRAWWHAPWLGYPLAIVFTAGAFLIPWSQRLMGIQDYFVEPPFVVATLLVGWLWGIGPALLALILGVLALDYWVVPPLGNLSFFLWPDIVSFAPFILIQLIVLGLIVVQKRHRQELFLAHQAISTYAEELASSNQALTESNQALARSNAQMNEANHMKEQFLSNASHELKTPITTIRGQAQLALRRLAHQQPQQVDMTFIRPHLEKIETQTQRLNELVNDLLNLSSLRSGKLPLRLAPCDLCSLCREIVEDQRMLYGRCICLKLPPAPVTLQADQGRLCQVVINLVVNAIKYSPADSSIDVEVLQRGAQAILRVHNAGSVIPQERLNNLFEPFYRTPEAHTSAVQGWGLGLAISKEIIEQHGGSIGVESSEEQGTIFSIELPLQQSQTAQKNEMSL